MINNLFCCYTCFIASCWCLITQRRTGINHFKHKTEKELKEEDTCKSARVPTAVTAWGNCRTSLPPPSEGWSLQSNNHHDFLLPLGKLVLSEEGSDRVLHAATNKMWHPQTQTCHPICPVCTVSPFLRLAALETTAALELKLYSWYKQNLCTTHYITFESHRNKYLTLSLLVASNHLNLNT